MQHWSSSVIAAAIFACTSVAGAQHREPASSILPMSYTAAAAAFQDAPTQNEHTQRLLAITRPNVQRAARPHYGAAVLAQSGDVQARARTRFNDGVRLANELQWTQAATAFEESYQLFPRPATLFNLGLAHRALGRSRRAIEELERFLTEGTPNEADRAQVTEALTTMRSQLAHITVVPSADGARIVLDGEPIEGNSEIPLDPGNHVLEVTAPGFVRNAQNVTLRQSETRRLEVRMERGGGVPTGAVIGIVAGVVVAGAVAGILIWQLSGEEKPYCGTLNQCIQPQ